MHTFPAHQLRLAGEIHLGGQGVDPRGPCATPPEVAMYRGINARLAGELYHIYGGGVMDGTQLRTSSYECRIITSYSPSDTGLGYIAGNNVTRFYLYPFKL